VSVRSAKAGNLEGSRDVSVSAGVIVINEVVGLIDGEALAVIVIAFLVVIVVTFSVGLVIIIVLLVVVIVVTFSVGLVIVIVLLVVVIVLLAVVVIVGSVASYAASHYDCS